MFVSLFVGSVTLLDDVFPDVGFTIKERKLQGIGADVG